MADLRPQGSMGPVGVKFDDNISTGGMLPKTKGTVPYSGYNEMVMKAFLASNDNKMPEDISELNAFIKYSKPDWPMFNDAQFKDAIASVQLGRKITGQKEMAAVEKERRKQALDTENAIVNRIAKIEDDELKNAADIMRNKDFSTSLIYFDKELNPTPEGQALLDGTYAKKEAEKRIATDSKLKTLRERQSKLTELIERPQPQAAKKERPSGGGMITVAGKQRPGDPYREGSRAIVTPDGTQIIAEKLENGKYAIKTKKEIPGVPGKWQRLSGEVPEEEIFRRFPENEIPAFTQKEPLAPAQAELPAPPKEAYPEFDINDALRGTPPVVSEDMLRDVPSTGLLPPGLEKAYIPGYPGIDENYIDPYAGYIPDERDRTSSGLPPPGFEEWLRSQYQ